MGRIALAFKLFFKTMGNADFAQRAQSLVTPAAEPPPRAPSAQPTAPTQSAPTRSDAITLLAVLQRESRLIDFLKEDISAYADAQIGAAVRDVHRDAGAALERTLALRPILEQPEGAEVPIPTPTDPTRFKLSGNLGPTPPPRGRLQHQGWQATKLELPQYTAAHAAGRIIAPAEVEV